MSVKIPLGQVIAGGFAIFCFSSFIGAKLQTKYLRYLLKISSTYEEGPLQRLATTLVHENLNLKFNPYDEEK